MGVLSHYPARMSRQQTALPDVPSPPFVMTRADAGRALADAEWLLTTGHGGFAMGTALGVARRKYHTMLNGAATPPVDRIATVSMLDERIGVEGGSTMRLGAHHAPGATLDDGASAHLERFEKEATTARWRYRAPGIVVVKELRVGWRRNAGAVRYRIEAERAGRFEITPWMAMRDFHDVRPDGVADPITFETIDARTFRASAGERACGVTSDVAAYRAHGTARVLEVFYELEHGRRLPDTDQLVAPGVFEASFGAGATEIVVAFALAPDEPDVRLFDADPRAEHLASVRAGGVRHNAALAGLEALIDASDDFLVRRVVDGEALMSVIAGYPWFADWGRDTMISLPGLMLSTGRFEDARSCLETFARHVSRGMIPNRFDDYGGPPHYNTVDASLWFLHAARAYLDASGDRTGFDRHMRGACHEIIEHYQRGTRFSIGMDPRDSLIFAGDATTQLTWMDAKRDGIVFTPRHGKAVEINALWHHGLVSFAGAIEGDEPARADAYRALAARVASSFRERFVGGPSGGLHDCLRAGTGGAFEPTGELRPNQIFAASLEHSPLQERERSAVVACVREHLLTPVGLRTLAPGDAGYQARFEGDMIARDRAYHNGTVWPWLIGPYAEAVLRAGGFSEAARAEAADAIATLIGHMASGCLGQIAEVYDGEEPRRQEGCTAQAWSVAEVLRVGAMVRK